MDGDIITSELCQFDGQVPGMSPPRSTSVMSAEAPALDSRLDEFLERPLREAKDRFTGYYVERCYRQNGFNATRAARACGMSRESFHRFLKKYDVRRERSTD